MRDQSYVMQNAVVQRGLLAENQLGTVALVQGAKERALLNIAINQEHRNCLKTTWLDLKKAFDSVDHSYLIACIQHLNLPTWIFDFLKSIISRWEISIKAGRAEIMNKKIERGYYRVTACPYYLYYALIR